MTLIKCPECNYDLSNKAYCCPRCGYPLRPTICRNIEPDINNSGLNLLSFFFPLIGLLLYLYMKDLYPVKAGRIKKFTLIGFAIVAVPVLLFTILFFAVFAGAQTTL